MGFGGGSVEGGGKLESLGPEIPSAKLRGFQGNVLQGKYKVRNDQDCLTFMPPGTAEFSRLRLYIRVGESSFDRARLSLAQTLLEQLQRFAAFVDFRRPILTFAGIDPGNPSDVTPGEDIESYEGLDIAEYLG